MLSLVYSVRVGDPVVPCEIRARPITTQCYIDVAAAQVRVRVNVDDKKGLCGQLGHALRYWSSWEAWKDLCGSRGYASECALVSGSVAVILGGLWMMVGFPCGRWAWSGSERAGGSAGRTRRAPDVQLRVQMQSPENSIPASSPEISTRPFVPPLMLSLAMRSLNSPLNPDSRAQ